MSTHHAAAASTDGYYRYPALHGDTLLFVCEDDIYGVHATLGGRAHRVTDAPGPVRRPVISPDGALVAFTVSEPDGHEEIYVVSVEGGRMRRLTRAGADFARVATWSEDGEVVYFVTSASRAFPDDDTLWRVPSRGGAPEKMTLGPVSDAQFRPTPAATDGAPPRPPARLIGRHTEDPSIAHWKGYRGGAGGEVWLDVEGVGDFKRVEFFTPDGASFEGSVGNVSWCRPDLALCVADDGRGRASLCSFRPMSCAEDVTRERTHSVGQDSNGSSSSDATVLRATLTPRATAPGEAHGARHPAADASQRADATESPPLRVAFVAGGRLFMSELASDSSAACTTKEIAVQWTGAKSELERRAVDEPSEFLQDWSLHPEGLTLATTIRGRAFTMGLWDGPALSYPCADVDADVDALEEAFREKKNTTDATPTPGAAALRHVATRATGSFAPRARLASYLWDGKRLAFVSDATGEDDIEIHREDGKKPRRMGLPPALLGRPISLAPSPEAPLLAVTNHRNALLIVDVDAGTCRTADVSEEQGGITHVAWSPCGCWVAYTKRVDSETTLIRILDARTGVTRDATTPVLGDCNPGWDPAGDFLYFLSSRELEPAYDAHRFGLSFHGAHRPHCVALRADVKNPLLKALTPPGDHSSDSEGDGDDDGSDSDDDDSYADGSDSNDEDKCPPIVIEWEGLRDRVVALPVPPGRYGHVRGLDDGRFMFVKYPIRRGGRVGLDAPYYGDDGGSDAENERADDSDDEDAGGVGALCKFDVRRLKTSVLIPSGVRSVVLSMDRRCMLVEKSVDGYVELRAHKAGTKPDEEDSDGEDVDEDAFDRRSGLIDIDGRIAAEVDPLAEWTQALLETWRICRDEWFDAGMAHGDARGVADWEGALTRHARLLPRVASVAELSDVLREMTAELRSSHVHVSLGDAGSTARRRSPAPGRLGCDLVWDAKMRGYRITHIVGGDQWDDLTGGALRKPGLNVAVGDAIVALNRVTLTEEVGVDEVLTGKGGAEVMVTFKVGDRGGGGGGGGGRSTGEIAPAAAASDKKNRSGGSGAKHKKTKGKDATAADAAGANGTLKRGDVVSVRVRAMHSELDARYRDAVRDRTSRVAKLGKDQVGYLHLPDMERTGYSEFWRHFPREVKKGALIVDLRGNAGGHISELLLAKLAQRPLAWDVPRRGAAATYPSHACGPLVVLVDENTGSDAELAAEAFRALGLGVVVGCRTWGGLLTTSESYGLVDGGEVSLPQSNVALFRDEKVFAVGNNDAIEPETSASTGAATGTAASHRNVIENRGVTPDVVVRISPTDHALGRDPQLDAAVEEATRLLRERPPPKPPGKKRPEDERYDDVTRATRAEEAFAGGSKHLKRWPFKTFAPFPQSDSSEEASSDDEDDEDATESESDSEREDANARRARGGGGGGGGGRKFNKPKGAKPKR